jgi:PAS domain S-box-containing protein
MTGFILSPYVIVMLTAAVICLLIGLYTWQHLSIFTDRITSFLMMLGITEWLTAAALGYAVTNPADKILWAKLEYIGVVSVPYLVLCFSLNYSGLKQWFTKRNIILASIIPAVTLLLVWTNELHGLVWSSYAPYVQNGVMLSTKTYGTFFWVYWTYSYILLMAASVTIIRAALLASKVFRPQASLLILAILFPWLGNLIYILHLSPLGNMDLTPLSFFLTGIILSLGVVHWRLFDIMPTAQMAIIENLQDGIIVLGSDDRVVDINPAAQSIFSITPLKAIGRHGNHLLPSVIFPAPGNDVTETIRLDIVMPYEKYYDLTATRFDDKKGAKIGRVVMIHDITESKAMQQKLADIERNKMETKISESEEKYQSLFDNASDAIIIADTETGIIIDANKQAEVLLGRSRDEIIDLNRARIHPEDKTAYYIDQFSQHVIGKKAIDYNSEIVKKDGTIVPVSISAGILQLNGRKVMQGIFRDITERAKEEELLKEHQNRIMGALEKTVESMGIVTAIRDPFTQQHQRHVAQLSVLIASDLGLSPDKIKAIGIASLIHDIGKIYVPADILSKPGKLSGVEFDIAKMHVEAAREILKPIEFPWPILDMILQHHERINGSGYPHGLKDGEICIEGRIMAVADVVEAMTSHRPYRPAMSIESALNDIETHRGVLYDADVVDSCLRLFRSKKFKFEE